MTVSSNIIGIGVFAVFAVLSDRGWASFQLSEQSGSGLGNAFAGQAAAAENASTIFFNPAGMTYLPGKQISGSLHSLRPSIKFTNDGTSTSPGGVAAPAGGTMAVTQEVGFIFRTLICRGK